jgi:transposase
MLELLRLILDTPWMRELSVAKQRYQSVLSVISDGLAIKQVAEKAGVSRQMPHSWLARKRDSVPGDGLHQHGRGRT